jgi:hypothetical protein
MKIVVNLLFVGLFFLNSCIVIKFPSSAKYEKLDSASKAKVIFNDEQCCTKKNQDLVYVVNASQLKKCLSLHPKSIVYMWAPHCHGDHCVPLSIFVNTSLQKGYYPIIVVEYIEFPIIQDMNNTEYPVFTMDHRYYHQQKTNKCIEPFLLELTRQKKKKENYGARYLIFEKDRFVGFKVDLNTLVN